MEREFKPKINFAVFVFLAAYLANTFYTFINGSMKSFISLMVFGIIICAYFFGLRPYKYVVDRKTLYIKYRLRKAKEIDLMQCETVCDPVPRFSEFYNRPHAIELYTVQKKRYCFFPKQRVEFVEAIVRGNKRIHCTVQDFTDVHRQLERKLRKEKRKAEKKAAREREKGSN